MSQQLSLLGKPDEGLPVPDEIVECEGTAVYLYIPKFQPWFWALNEHLLDMTGYGAKQFALFPTTRPKVAGSSGRAILTMQH